MEACITGQRHKLSRWRERFLRGREGAGLDCLRRRWEWAEDGILVLYSNATIQCNESKLVQWRTMYQLARGPVAVAHVGLAARSKIGRTVPVVDQQPSTTAWRLKFSDSVEQEQHSIEWLSLGPNLRWVLRPFFWLYCTVLYITHILHDDEALRNEILHKGPDIYLFLLEEDAVSCETGHIGM